MFSLQAGIISRFYKWKQDFSYCPLLMICFWAVISDGTLATLQIPQPGTFKVWACDCWSDECRATISSQDWNRPSNKPAALDTHTAMQNWAGRSSLRTGQVLEKQGLLQFQLSGSCIKMFTDSSLCLIFTAFSRLLLEAGSVLAYFSSFSSFSFSITSCTFSKTFSSPFLSLPLTYS